jgi:hypothetical protein
MGLELAGVVCNGDRSKTSRQRGDLKDRGVLSNIGGDLDTREGEQRPILA